ncbi:MAG: hypothetical protein WCH01_22865 [Methylococcaceae bacterium]
MPKLIAYNKLHMCSLMTAAMVAASQGTFADTRLQIPVIPEKTQVYNALAIVHGCDDPVTGTTSTPVFGESVVFPDGVDSTITVDNAASNQPLSAFVQNWGNTNKKIQSNDVFPLEAEKTDALGNVVGFWGGNGKLPGVNYIGLNPFVTGAVFIEPTSCAKSVTFVLAIVDVCKMTNISGFNKETANLWTPAVGSNYDGRPETNDGFDSPATLKITRNLTTNPLPSACGAGTDVVVTPSANQINRDMPVFIDGKQAWPLP